MEPREVCKICYNSTSHKPAPTLTYEPKENSDDDGSAPLICAVCRQEWAPIRVAKELGSNRWVRIRPRPKLQPHIDFMMCKNLKSRAECPRGQDCSYAHSQAELWAWNQERQKEPRPAPHINGSYQYQLCKYISKSGNCPYGNKCTFAHNEEELQAWLKVQGPLLGGGGSIGGSSTGSSSRSSSSGYGSGVSYKCNVCHLKCNSKKQLEEHLNHSKHRQQHHQGAGSGGGGSRQQTGGIPRFTSRTASSGQARPRPTLSFQITGFRLCVHVQNGRRCLYGDYCTFAHSQAELDEWNQQPAKSSNATFGRSSYNKNESQQSSTTPTNQTTSEKPAPMNNGTKGDFSSSVRRDVSKEHKEVVSGLEASSKEGVSVSEVTDMELAMTTTTTAPISWVFEVTTSVPHILQSVVLLDTLNNDFDITYILKHNSGSWEKVSTHGCAEQGVGMLLNYKMLPADKLQVKVTVKPRSGLLGQAVIFQFGSFRILQCLMVRVISESEEKMRKPKPHLNKRPANVDMFWENHFTKIGMENLFEEEMDTHLPEYFLPQQIETLIEKGKYSNVENRVTKENYKRRMHNLLYLEEYQQRSDLSRYDLYDIEIKLQSQYVTGMGAVNFAGKGYHFIMLVIDELLFEGGQSVRQGDSALLLPSNQQVMHECLVEHVGRDNIILKLTEKAKQASAASRFRVSIRFVLGRITMRGMHYAVDQLDLDTLFPVAQATPSSAIPTSSEVQECLDVLKDSELNPFQLQAITSMLDSSCSRIPSLVLGPFGCGKTHTLSECIAVLASHMPSTRILVCTHSNSAADIYVENLDARWSRYDGEPPSLFRLYFTMRRLNSISPVVRKYCKIVQERLMMPTLAELKSYKIVVATLSTARALPLMELAKGHFTHIFIDEAAQALESEALIPLCLANSKTKIVLAGDHMQLDPPVYSDIARKYGLHVSLLERLYDLDAYESGVGQLCKTLLTENHRSHHLILDLPSQLFYKNKLSCKAKFPPGGPVNLPAVKFVSVDGQEEQDEDSPSYYNAQEAIKVAEEAKLLTDGGLRSQDICVISYYSKQVTWIRNVLRRNQLGQVQVHRVDNVQGKEFRALIISTVRTSATEPSSENEAGFLTNPKLFNTAVTRARQWLIVIGEPVTLCTIGSNRLCWLEYIRRCIGLKSFDHPHPSQFIGRLDYKMMTRQLMEKTHPKFFKSSSVQRGPRAKTVSTPTSQQSTFEPSKRSQAPIQPVRAQQEQQQQVTSTVSVGEDVKPHSRSFASKVLDSQSLGKDSGRESSALTKAASRMTSPAPKLPVVAAGILTNHSTVQLTSPKQATPSPPNHTSRLLNHSGPSLQHTDEIGLEDLPLFLRNMVESVNVHTGWCEQMMSASYPLRISSKVNDNLQRQKSILEDQTKFVQEQIQLYRDYIKLCDTQKEGTKSVGQAELSSTQQFHFPTALPSNPLSATLNSTAFSYDTAVGNSYFASEPSSVRQSGASQILLKD